MATVKTDHPAFDKAAGENVAPVDELLIDPVNHNIRIRRMRENACEQASDRQGRYRLKIR